MMANSNSKLTKVKRILGFGNTSSASNQEVKSSSLEHIQEKLNNAQAPEIEETSFSLTQDDGGSRTFNSPSTFKQETRVMENARRDLEQTGHRRLGIAVHARERINDEPLSLEQGMEAQAASSLMQNPLLDNQRFDGADPNVNPVPAMNMAAQTEFENIKREQELKKQLRLGLSPDNAKRFNAKPTPRGY